MTFNANVMTGLPQRNAPVTARPIASADIHAHTEQLIGTIPKSALPAVLTQLLTALKSFQININGQVPNTSEELAGLLAGATASDGRRIIGTPNQLAQAAFGLQQGILKGQFPINHTNMINITTQNIDRLVSDPGVRQALLGRYFEASRGRELNVAVMTRKEITLPTTPTTHNSFGTATVAEAQAAHNASGDLDGGVRVVRPLSLISIAAGGYVSLQDLQGLAQEMRTIGTTRTNERGNA